MNEIISKIEALIDPNLSLNLTVDEKFLGEIEAYFISNGFESNHYEPMLIALGLLNLYRTSHEKIKEASSHHEVSRLILIGDYFYSLYYQYCANHAFYLIKHNFAKKLKEFELSLANQSSSSLLSYIFTFFAEEVPHYEFVN